MPHPRTVIVAVMKFGMIFTSFYARFIGLAGNCDAARFRRHPPSGSPV
jgi:hypothetical protein